MNSFLLPQPTHRYPCGCKQKKIVLLKFMTARLCSSTKFHFNFTFCAMKKSWKFNFVVGRKKERTVSIFIKLLYTLLVDVGVDFHLPCLENQHIFYAFYMTATHHIYANSSQTPETTLLFMCNIDSETNHLPRGVYTYFSFDILF